MVYRVIGLMSGSSLDGLDIAYVHLQEISGKWNYEIISSACYPYQKEWIQNLRTATSLTALEYQLLHVAYGHYLGRKVNQFISEYNLQYQVQLISSHGHTIFHFPEKKMTAQLGDGAALAITTGINVVSDLRAIDMALGGQGAPIVPIGEKLLFSEYDFFLNLGGIANISSRKNGQFIGFDICPANRVLNMLANEENKEYDLNGEMAAKGEINGVLLEKLNQLAYYGQPYPKSLSNDFGMEIIYPMVRESGSSLPDRLRTYVEHICIQIKKAAEGLLESVLEKEVHPEEKDNESWKPRLLITGGGALNSFLVEQLMEKLKNTALIPVVPSEEIIQYKEALVMALIGVLRWREEDNVLASVTGASRNSIGGAVWMGQHA
jgi:anhydro-N-acetylmuramic acid kinase